MAKKWSTITFRIEQDTKNEWKKLNVSKRNKALKNAVVYIINHER